MSSHSVSEAPFGATLNDAMNNVGFVAVTVRESG